MDDLFFEKPVITDRDQLLRHKLLIDEELSDLGYILKWECFTLNIQTGSAEIAGTHHQFEKERLPYQIFRILLEARILNPNSGDVTFDDFKSEFDIDKEKTKTKIRELRESLGVSGENNQKNEEADIFQALGGRGYKLVVPRNFRK
jgi:hypothetical protein